MTDFRGHCPNCGSAFELFIRIPSGAVAGAATSGSAPASGIPPAQAGDEPPHPADAVQAAARVMGDDVAEWPAGKCPKHQREWKAGRYGPYCTAPDAAGPKGYCPLRPGDLFNGKRAA